MYIVFEWVYDCFDVWWVKLVYEWFFVLVW